MKYSVVIPCYNCAGTVARAVGSVDDGDAEIICVDDGSTDGTSELISGLRQDVRLVKLDKNYGPGRAINEGIRESKTGYIFVLGADNYVPKNLISMLYAKMLEAKADGAAPEEIRYVGGKIKRRFNPHVNGVCDLNTYIKTMKNHGSSGHYLFTKDSWSRAGGYPEEPGLEGWVFGLRQLAAGCRIIIVKGTYHFHTLSKNSLWKRWERKGLNRIAAAKAVKCLSEK
jgi:glycosyltransferase involved in cell wall biosynthesis